MCKVSRTRLSRLASAAGFLTLLTVVSLPSRACAALLISEVLYDAAGSDNGGVFVELHGAPGASLGGVTLEGVNGSDGSVYETIALTGMVPGSGVFVLADDQGDGTTLVPNADLVANFDFQNGPDSIVLRRDGTLLDALGYGDFVAGTVFAGEGSPAPDAGAGQSLARRAGLPDTGDNAVDFELLDTPTPGVVPGVTAVPLPPSAVLMMSGVLAVVPLMRIGGRGG